MLSSSDVDVKLIGRTVRHCFSWSFDHSTFTFKPISMLLYFSPILFKKKIKPVSQANTEKCYNEIEKNLYILICILILETREAWETGTNLSSLSEWIAKQAQ